MAYRMAKRLITNGNYERADMMDKLGVLLLAGTITQAQYDELVALMPVAE